MKIKLYLYQIRVEKNLSARQMAERSWVSKTHILNIESGNTSPTIDCLLKLAEGLGVSIYELFSVE